MNGLLELRLGWNIRKVIGGGGGVQKKNASREELREKIHAQRVTRKNVIA